MMIMIIIFTNYNDDEKDRSIYSGSYVLSSYKFRHLT